jgi:hypothetical protein
MPVSLKDHFRGIVEIVSDNVFLEEHPSPDPAAIKAALGESYPWYEGILEAASDFQQDWKHYGKKYGWKLKAHDGVKALFELSVTTRGLRIGMAVRERELQALRADPAAAADLAELLDAEKANEGWGIRLMLDDERRYRQALLLIRSVAKMRKGN